MKYKFLLFDMDDTLFDFQQTEKVAFRKLIEQNNIEYTDELVATYKRINHKLWTGYELGKIDKSLIFTRFDQLLTAIQLPADGRAMECQYRELLGQGIYLKPDAELVCRIFAADHEMYIVTNGVAGTQYSRLKESGLDKYFLDVFISENIGAAKPAAEFFDYVKTHGPGFESDKALIIGDSLICDIDGGKKAGLDTCWIKNEADQRTSENADYTIHNLIELMDIVKQ